MCKTFCASTRSYPLLTLGIRQFISTILSLNKTRTIAIEFAAGMGEDEFSRAFLFRVSRGFCMI
jgi:hypothetical protein